MFLTPHSLSNVQTPPVSMSATQGMFPTVTSVVPGSSSEASMVPYDRSSRLMPPYNSSMLCMKIVPCLFM